MHEPSNSVPELTDEDIRLLLGKLRSNGQAYIYIYLLEVRLRQLVHHVLRARYEPDHRNAWLRQAIEQLDPPEKKGKLATTLEGRRDAHRKKGAYLPVAENSLLTFLSLAELKQLIVQHWDDFEPYFLNCPQFVARLETIEAIRNSTAHNRSLIPDSVDELKNACLPLIRLMGGLGPLDETLNSRIGLDIVEELFSHRYLDVVGVYRDRSDFDTHVSYNMLFNDSVKTIEGLGLSLNAITINYGADKLFRLVHDQGVQVRLIFLKPHGTAISERETEEGYKKEELSHLTETNISMIQKIMIRLPTDQSEYLQARTYDRNLRHNIYIIDRKFAVVQHYHYFSRGVEAPTFLIKPKLGEDGIFEYFVDQFETIWSTGKPVKMPRARRDK